ncbi:MAG: bifunctional phosphopantothenoylcysteine decarboxylase/phosphopantothenate--cysteine ligase CoaBC [Oceanospirillaceae bacterium]|nr:bifunctional phosphopantothenoylcysteine decarboxylase/phosphopantothenate--cysteine ligase CoaBC [Oceanospirillaceae bacterium]MCP5334725.1 bifunctional phosphopantothenoylcysteine decarboxylase/phosphopantothenate--cysteine ligase CoaBC [Oceanospirillaceae bacterium]
MSSLTNKRVLLGITGGIAAYKSAELVRALKTAGAEVRVVMTSAAREFITPLTLQALSGNPVHHSLLDPEAEAGMGHIELARWADLMIIAPASADFIARLAAGMGNDLLTTLCLASNAPLALAPAMNQAMWRDTATQQNIQQLLSRSEKKPLIWGPAAGEQACGDVGPGRMLEPLELARLAAEQFASGALAGKTLLITAGPTREAIDPVRYISNHSSGKMGYALAEAARDAGARVILVSGPVNLPCPRAVERISVSSADEMLAAVQARINDCQIMIGAAAVADYKVASVAGQKIKKSADEMILTLIKNPDIIATVAALPNKPFVVGFAAETNDVENYARDKLKRKNLDMIVANDVSRSDIGFNSDDNAVTLFWAEQQQALPLASKHQVARGIIAAIATRLQEKP